MNFFENKLNGIRRRINSVKYGMFYLRNSDYKIPEVLTINGRKKKFHVESMDIIEFTAICINDCYHLKYLKRKLGSIKTIVDIGANCGMFAIAARQLFPKAKIDCYEPNPHLAGTLRFNAKQLDSIPYFEAVMKYDCKVKLNFTESDLATTAIETEGGSVIGSSLTTVLKRIGNIDIIKLDCEGAEWDLLEDKENWKKVKSLTMEYHLWAKKGSKLTDIFRLLDAINFKFVHHVIHDSQQGLIVAVNKTMLS
jgi:FkbM family methyltransferase